MVLRVGFDRLEAVDPAVDQPVVSFAVVGGVVDLQVLAPQQHPVVGIGPNGAHRHPGDRAGGQLLNAQIGQQPGHQGEHRWRFGKQGILEYSAAGLDRTEWEINVLIPPVEVVDAMAAPVAA